MRQLTVLTRFAAAAAGACSGDREERAVRAGTDEYTLAFQLKPLDKGAAK